MVVMMVDVLVHVMVLVLLVGAESTFRLHLLFGSSFVVIHVIIVVDVILVAVRVVFVVVHLTLVLVVGGVLGRREETLLQPPDHLLFGSGLLHFAVPMLEFVRGGRLLRLAALVVEVRAAAVVGQVVGARSLVQHLADGVRGAHFQVARLQEQLVGGRVVVGGRVRRTLPAVDVLAGDRRRFPPLAVVRRQQRIDQRVRFSAGTDGMTTKISISVEKFEQKNKRLLSSS